MSMKNVCRSCEIVGYVFTEQIMRASISVGDTKRDVLTVAHFKSFYFLSRRWLLFNVLESWMIEIFLEKLDFDRCCYEFLTQMSAQMTQLSPPTRFSVFTKWAAQNWAVLWRITQFKIQKSKHSAFRTGWNKRFPRKLVLNCELLLASMYWIKTLHINDKVCFW